MESKIMKLSWANIKSALVTTFLAAIMAMAIYVYGLGDIFKIEVRALANVGALSVLTGVISLIKSLLTTEKGNFVGIVKVKEDEFSD